MTRFTDLARTPGPPLEALLVSLAAEFRPVDAAQASRTIARLAAALAATDRIATVGDILGSVLGFRPTRTPGPDALLLDTALRDKEAEPVVLAAIYVVVAGRAGIPLTIVGTGDRWLVADGRSVLDPVQSGALLAADEIPADLRAVSPHETANALLVQLLDAYAAQGDLRRATQAAELRFEIQGLRPRAHGSTVRSSQA